MTTISIRLSEMSVRSDDADLYVRTAGGGPGSDALVVLAGGPGLSCDYLTGLYGLASTDLRVVLYDQRGVGRSIGQLDSDLLDNQVRDLVAVQEALGIQKAHLLGHSGGGLLVMLAAQQRPDIVASAIFIDSAPPTRAELDVALGALASRIEALTASGVIALPDEPADQTAWVRAAFPTYFYDPRHPRAHAHGGVTLSGAAYAAMLETLGDYDLTRVLRSLSVPSLVIACHAPFGVGMGMSVARDLPEARTDTAVLDQCGHLPWLEAPELFESLVRTFLTTRCGVAASPSSPIEADEVT